MRGKIAWLVPAPLKGSGGHRTIFQNVTALADRGAECHLYFQESKESYETASDVERIVEEWFGRVPATFHVGYAIDRDVDVGFATAWFTAEPLRRSRRAKKKAYFVQDYEAYFMPMSDGFLLAENSFRYGFHGTSIGNWLTRRLGEDFGMRCTPFDFCADRSVYRPLPHERRELAVCFVYQPEKPRRCSLIGGQALHIVKREMPEVAIRFYGTDAPASVPFEFEHLGLMPIKRCNELYNQCTVGLCISATNPSRIPFEMMAAGLPVVDVYRDNTLYDMPDDAVLLAEPTPESIAHALLRILRDREEQRARSKAGLEFMRDRGLERGFGQFAAFVEQLLGDDVDAGLSLPEKVYRKPPVSAPAEVSLRYQDILSGALPPAPPPGRVAKLLARTRATLDKFRR